jgi:hypothetical protein
MRSFDKRDQFRRFFAALFKPNELIEFRFIESWTNAEKRKSRVVVPAQWIRAGQVAEEYDDLVRFAETERANIYFGVCPRPRVGDATDETIRTIRCLWADVDDVTVDEAWQRWEATEIPEPSIVVNSGRGVHAYWLLARDLMTHEECERIARLLPSFYTEFGGDHVQNLSRIMRPPGTVNCKGARNGDQPLPCQLVECELGRRYHLDDFDRWTKPENVTVTLTKNGITLVEDNIPTSSDVFANSADISLLAARLDLPCHDRSRRDFAIVCGLLRLGLSPEEIWAIVADKSKFETGGRSYFELTVANAERAVSLHATSSAAPELPA